MAENPFAAVLRAPKATPLEGRPGSIEALYVVHFGGVVSPDDPVNGGVVVLETGRVFGGDSGYYYTGSYSLGGQMLEANPTVERHNMGWQNVWGDRSLEFDIQFIGKRRDDGSVIEGTMRRLDVQSMSLAVRWFRMRDLP